MDLVQHAKYFSIAMNALSFQFLYKLVFDPRKRHYYYFYLFILSQNAIDNNHHRKLGNIYYQTCRTRALNSLLHTLYY